MVPRFTPEHGYTRSEQRASAGDLLPDEDDEVLLELKTGRTPRPDGYRSRRHDLDRPSPYCDRVSSPHPPHVGTDLYEVAMARDDDPLVRLPVAFRWSQARDAGLSDPQLYRLVDEGVLERIGHGLYIRTDQGPIDIDLVEIACASPSATLCLTTALARHDLTDEIPAVLDVAVPRDDRRPATRAPVRWHRFARDTFDLGRGRLAVHDELYVGLYSAERSIVDAYRLRHLEGDELGRQALRRWLARPAHNRPP